MKRNSTTKSRSKIALAILAAIGVASKASAEDGTELVDASAIEGVVEVRQLSDGSIELVLEDGSTVSVDAGEVAIDNGRVMITADAVAALADAGSFAFLDGNGALIAAGVAATALAVGLGVGLSDGDDDDDIAPPLEPIVGTEGDDTLTGSPEADTIDGLGGNDTISGLGGDDTLIGGTGNDTLDGGAGTDSLTGNDGDDTFISDGQDDIFGGEGTDTVDFSNLTEGVFVDLDTNTPNPGPASQDGAVLDAPAPAGGQQIQELDDIENVIGSQGNDVIFGNNEVNILDGGAGDDVFHSFAGADTINGGEGSDTALFSAGGAVTIDLDDDGNAVVNDGAGDTLTSIENLTGSNAGDDSLSGNSGTNILNGNGGSDSLFGEGGDDTLVTDGIDTILDGGEGIDTIDLSNISEGVTIDLDTNTPQPGPASQDGLLTVGENTTDIIDVENVIGTDGDDIILGNNEINILDGGAGNDAIHSFAGADTIIGGEGIDTALFTAGPGVVLDLDDNGDGVASVNAPDGATLDSVFGFENINGSNNAGSPNGGADVLSGNSGTNVLNGQVGDDTLDGEGGDDTLIGGLGNDTLIGGEGIDTADFSDIDVPITLDIDADGNGTVTRETGFGVSFENVSVDPDNLLENATLNPELSGDLITEAVAGNLYFNVHTDDFNAGEIRGQLTVASDETDADGVRTIVLEGALDAFQEPGPTSDSTATGSGTVTFVVAADGSITYSAELDITGLATSDLLPVSGFSSIHLHNAPAGVNGPVVLDIIQDAGGDIAGAVAPGSTADTGDGNVFDEVTETDTLESIEIIVGSDDVDTVDLSSETEAVFVDLDVNSPPGSDASQVGALLDAAPNAGGQAVIGLTDFENVNGGSGDDVIFGNNEINILQGNAGDDVFHSFAGADTIDGGTGSDTALFSAGGAVTVDLDEDGNASVNDGAGDTLISIENLVGSNAGDDSLSGNSGANLINGNGGSDSLFGESGDDILVSDGVDTLVDGGEGIDTIDFSGITDSGINIDLDTNTPQPGPATQTGAAELFDGTNAFDNNPFDVVDVENVIGTDQNDRIFGNNEVNVLDGGAGDDVFHSFAGADFVNGGEGTDTVLFSAGGAVTIDLDDNGNGIASVGDTLTSIENITGSAAGDDTISGNAGVNVLNGNGGNDTLTGEGGADVFIETDGSGADTITDFVVDEDVIDVAGHGLTAAEALALAVDNADGNAFIDFGDGDTLTLTGVAAADLTEASFSGTDATASAATEPVDLSDFPEDVITEQLITGPEDTETVVSAIPSSPFEIDQAAESFELGLESPPASLSGSDLGDSL
ncbi:MAG: CHRD domain-containing protein [Pseudomonadota bacterium]